MQLTVNQKMTIGITGGSVVGAATFFILNKNTQLGSLKSSGIGVIAGLSTILVYWFNEIG
jgi:hypothetical protein